MIKLGDFGLAVQLEHSCSRKQTLVGTWYYTAPEVYEGQTCLKSDVWSLGMSLIELAEGKHPFDGCNSAMVMKRVLSDDPPALSSSVWSADCVDFVSKCLLKVNERWSVSELMNVSLLLGDDG